MVVPMVVPALLVRGEGKPITGALWGARGMGVCQGEGVSYWWLPVSAFVLGAVLGALLRAWRR